MFTQYFGNYLLNQGLVTVEQLRKALDSSVHTRVKLGVHAINQGYMTAKQVEEVHKKQMTMDQKFGEIAISLNYLSQDKVDLMLSMQFSGHLLLGQTLIDMEVITYESFSECMLQYKREYSLSDDQFTSIVNGDVDMLVAALFAKSGQTYVPWIKDYVTLFAKNLIRFVDSGIRIEIGVKRPESFDWVYSQIIEKVDLEQIGITALVGSEASFLHFATRYAQETVDIPDEMMHSSVGEFLNLHNGLFLVNLSNQGIELDLMPPLATRDLTIQDSQIILEIRIISDEMTIDLFVTDFTCLM